MAERGRFYVYAFFEGEKAVYVGKGSGRRFHNQKRRFQCEGRILKEFATEAAAYRFEAATIARLKPEQNKASGGGGAVSSRKAALPAWFRRQLAEIERVGSRVYAARELLDLGFDKVLPSSKVEIIRMVSRG